LIVIRAAGRGRTNEASKFTDAQIAFILRQAEEAFGSITAGQSIRGMTATVIVGRSAYLLVLSFHTGRSATGHIMLNRFSGSPFADNRHG
jgi:hypothetical protein